MKLFPVSHNQIVTRNARRVHKYFCALSSPTRQSKPYKLIWTVCIYLELHDATAQRISDLAVGLLDPAVIFGPSFPYKFSAKFFE